MKYLLAISMFLVATVLSATHIRGGHIEYKQITDRTFEFTFIGYRDTDGVLFGNGLFDFGDGVVFGGEDSEDVISWTIEERVDNIEIWKFTLVHTYRSPGEYSVSYKEGFRNFDTANISESTSTYFYVQASLVIDPLLGTNSSPSFSAPHFKGLVGQPYLNAFYMTDPDGDSLSYKFVQPKQDEDQSVTDYKFPNDASLYARNPGIFKISASSGNLIWETDNLNIIPPLEEREFSMAVQVTQWRNGFKIGSNTIDYTIAIWNLGSQIKGGNLVFPESTCYSSNDIDYSDAIFFDNPDGIGLSITFSSNSHDFLINGNTIDDWNQQMGGSAITDRDFEIQITFDSEGTEGDREYNFLKMNVISDYSDLAGFMATYSQSQMLLLGANCDFNVLSIEEFSEDNLEIFSQGVRFLNGTAYDKAVISDLAGRIFLDEEVTNSETISFNFERNTIYLLTLVRDQEIKTKKILIK